MNNPPDAETLTGLKDIASAADSTLRPYNTLLGKNLGNFSLVATIPMHRFFTMSAVANEAGLEEMGLPGQPVTQRKLDPKHAQKLAVYLLRGLLDCLNKEFIAEQKRVPAILEQIRTDLGEQPYFALQPIVVNIRSCKADGAGLKFEQPKQGYITAYLSDNDIFWVIDGQHRRYAMELLFEFLEAALRSQSYPRRGPTLYQPQTARTMTSDELAVWQQVFELAKTKCTVLVDIHLGLNPVQERQLFHDLNNLGKKIESSLAFQFDLSNPINLFIKKQLVDNFGLQVVDKDKSDWHDDTGALSRKDLIAINAHLFLNKTTVSGAKPHDLSGKEDIAKEFWEAVQLIPHFGQRGAKKLTVAAQPVFLKALAKLTYDFAFGRDRNESHLETLIQGIPSLDLSHGNPIWRWYEFSPSERGQSYLQGLEGYLPPDTQHLNASLGANRDIGGWDSANNAMRFGAKHNDIYPILGDMVRFMLKLPARARRTADDELAR